MKSRFSDLTTALSNHRRMGLRIAEAIHQGLEMDSGEQRIRMQQLRRHLMDQKIYRWTTSILGDVRELRMENPRGADLIHGRQPSISSVEVVKLKTA